MKKLALQLVAFARSDFDPVVYAGAALWLGVLLVANYAFDAFAFVADDPRNPLRIVVYMAYYGVPWLVVLMLQHARGRIALDRGPGGAAAFWRMAGAGLFIVALTDWFPYHRDVVALAPREVYPWARGLAWNVKSTLCWLTPMLAFWLVFDRRDEPTFYGFTVRGVDLRPYLLCLALILPLVAWASFQPDFLRAYPTYRPGSTEAYLGVSPALTVGLYELIYGFDFTFVELYFRGFLVIGLARWLGPSAVLPMVAMYAVLHFGKPLPEALGSIVGGWALGVFALHSRSIAGGLLLHLGLAWSMEAAALAQHAAAGRL